MPCPQSHPASRPPNLQVHGSHMKTSVLAGDNQATRNRTSRPLSYRGAYDNMNEHPPTMTMPSPHEAPAYAVYGSGMSSERGMFTVGSFTPSQGQVGTVVTVALTLNFQIQGRIYIRLAAGPMQLETKVSRSCQSSDDPGARDWVIQAAMPPCDDPAGSSVAAPITVQILTDQKLLDLASCGYFTYTTPVTSPQYSVKIEREDALSTDRSESSRPRTTSRKTSAAPRGRPPRTVASPVPTIVRRNGRFHSGPRRASSHGIVRVPRYAEREGDSLNLEFMTSLEDMCQSWDSDELCANRRLVKFTILREGSHIMLHTERISQDDYSPDNDIVISCIRHEETASFHVTSVDVLSLFQAICGQKLSVKEKTRLRRNIQCFSPIRLSKTDCEYTSFYYLIMEMSNPKPRTIDKKLKVFNWCVLKEMLDKMLSKFCLPGTAPQQDVFHSYDFVESSQNAPELLHTDSSSEASLSPPPIERPCTISDRIKVQDDDSPAPLVLFYQEHRTKLVSSINPDNYQQPVASLEYDYDIHDVQSSICSTASEVEAVYMQYAYEPTSFQYVV